MELSMSENFGKIILMAGILLSIIGLLFLFNDKIGGFFGNLPGDFSYKGKGGSFYFPLMTSIILSIILTVVLNLFFWFFRK